TITAVNPLDHETDIKQLFVTHERADFPSFFDRAYPAGVRAGGVSWIGRNRAGQVVMHVACFPQRFRFGEREVVGGLMINALVAHLAPEFAPAPLEAPSGDSPRLRPYHSSARYAMRMEGYPAASDWWLTLPRNGDASASAAGLLVRGPNPAGVADLEAVHRDPGLPLAGLIRGLVAWLRTRGCTRLQVRTVAESQFA